MALNASKVPSGGGSRQEAMEPGTYPVRLAQVIDLGLQKQDPYMGEEKPPAFSIMLTYEFLDEFVKDEEGNDVTDKPRFLSEDMALHSLDSDLAKSTKRYFALDPSNEFNGDWPKVVGRPGMLTIVAKEAKKSGRVSNYVRGLSTMREKEAAKAPELVNPPKVFDLDDPDMEIFGSLPQWVQNKVKENLNFEGSSLDLLLQESGGKAKEEKSSDKPATSDDDDDGDW